VRPAVVCETSVAHRATEAREQDVAGSRHPCQLMVEAATPETVAEELEEACDRAPTRV
jgi:hypothetical protein